MIALDTNVLLRYVADPEAAEGPLATRLITEVLSREKPGFISTIVLAETLWVLGRAYGVSPEEQRQLVGMLLTMPQLVLEHADAVECALSLSHQDLADCILHEVGQSAGCSHTVSFDKRFARLDRVELVK